MFENVDWTLIFAAIAAISGSVAAIIQYYSKVYVPKLIGRERKREEIYKPLLMDVDALITSIKKKENFSAPFNWKTVEEKVSLELNEKLKQLFEVKVNYWYKLLEHDRQFIRFYGYFYLDNNLPELLTEFKSLGMGSLEYELYTVIVTPILEGEKISLRWLEDNKPVFFENLKKCTSYKSLNNFLDVINVETPCFINYKHVEEELLESAEMMRRELKEY